MQAGKLRNRIEIFTVTYTQPDPNRPDRAESLSLLDTVWAEVRVVSANIAPVAKSYGENVDYVVLIRFHPGVKACQRIQWNDQLLEIRGVIPDEKFSQQSLYCASITGRSSE